MMGRCDRKGCHNPAVTIIHTPSVEVCGEHAAWATNPPIPMIMYCPGCGERHIDKGEFATKPHHTHACQKCGIVWRPAVVPTVGVQFLPGFKDTP